MAKSEVIFWTSGFLLGGIVLASFEFPLWWGLLPIIILVGWFRYSREEIKVQHLILFLVAIFLGTFYFHAVLVIKENREIFPPEGQTFHAVVSGEAKRFEKVQRIPVRLSAPYRGEVTLVTTTLVDFEYGDELSIQGTVENEIWPLENTVTFPHLSKLPTKSTWSFRGAAIQLKNQWLGNFKQLLSSDQAALLGGLTFGARGDFNDSFREAMQRSGTTHLVALSGYNISILIWTVGYLFQSMFSRRLLFALTLIFISIFVLMVGAEASIVRAAIMGALILLASEAGRLYSFRHAVLYAALIMSLFDPSLPRFDLGFQLSFFSLLGIALLGPIVVSREKKRSFLNWRESLSITVSAQLGVLGILALNFGSISVVSIIANLLVLWAVPLLMALGFLAAALGTIHFSLSLILQPFLQIILGYMIAIIHLSALFPMLSTVWAPWMTILYYGILGWFVYHYFPYEDPEEK